MEYNVTMYSVTISRETSAINSAHTASRCRHMAGLRDFPSRSLVDVHLVTFGEPLIRLSVPRGIPMAHTRSFDAYVGGSELNVAID